MVENTNSQNQNQNNSGVQSQQNQEVNALNNQPQVQQQTNPAQPVSQPVQNSQQSSVQPQAQTTQAHNIQSAPQVKDKQAFKAKKKMILLLAVGLILFFLIAFVILFFLMSQTTSPESNPFIQIFGLNPEDWVPFLINITSAGFGFLVFVFFIVALIGIFKIAMSKKDDKKAKMKGFVMTGAGAVLCLLLIVVWMFVYLNLSAKRADQTGSVQKDFISTDPVKTVDLTAPMEISFDASAVERAVPAQYQILSYEWDFGDGTSFATGKQVTHLYTQKGPSGGRYKVSLTVTYKDLKDGTEKQDIFEKDIVFSNELAITEFTVSPDSGPAPLKVTFDASMSKDEDGAIKTFEWDLDEDGFYDDAEGQIAVYTYDKLGTYTVKLRTVDSNGESNIAEKEIKVTEGEGPIAIISVNSEEGDFYVGKSYLFDASKSESPVDSKLVKYAWDFGDGGTANTRTANYSFENAGTYEVKLTVTDENSFKGTNTFEIKIIDSKSVPEAIITPTPDFIDSDKTYIEGKSPFKVSFSAMHSLDADDDIVEYKWDFDGDGVFDDTGEIVSHIFQTAGEHNVILTVIDSDEQESKDSMIVKVSAHGLEAILTVSPVQGEAPLVVKFDASGSLYPEGTIISYEWDFGNGVKRNDIAQITYTYDTVGTYTAKVTAVASDGTKSIAEAVISVRPISIKACFETSVGIGEAPLEVEFDPSCSKGTVNYYFWDFGNGKTSRDRKSSTTYSKPGNYEVMLEVRDVNGVTSTITKDIVVTGEIE